MRRERFASLLMSLVSRWRRAVARAAALGMTIRGRILVAFLIMSVITAALGAYATLGIRNAGVLVDKTFDESLMSINYARAAAADFAAMRAAFARQWIATSPDMRAALDKKIDKLGASLSEDLEIAAERSQSVRATRAAENVQHAVDAWKAISERLRDSTKLDVNWDTLDHYAAKVDDQIDLLVNYTAGDGFLYRQTARAAVSRDVQLNIVGTALALLLSALVAWALARRIVGPVAVASNVAGRIAAGKLDVAIPHGSADELGALLAAMGVMRDNIKAMMDREVKQRRSAQARLADALECSQEGVVVVDANDGIVLANAQAADFLGIPASLLKPGTPLAQLEPALQGTARCRPNADPARQGSADDQRNPHGGRPLAAHQPQPDPRRRLHRPVQRYQPSEEAGTVAARIQSAARCRARKHVAGPLPLRCAGPARSIQSALPGNLQAAARSDQARHELSETCWRSASPAKTILQKR